MSELHTISLRLRGRADPLNMVFVSAAGAEAAFAGFVAASKARLAAFAAENAPLAGHVTRPFIEAVDDYGSRHVFFPEGAFVEVATLQDCGRAHAGNVELALLQARSQAAANEKAAHDPVLRKAQAGLPRVVAPGFPGMSGWRG